MKYQFTRAHRQFSAGDPVPDTYGKGLTLTLVQAGIVKAIGEPEHNKAITDPPQIKRGPGRPRKSPIEVN